MNGLQALQIIMREMPLPVIMVSSLTEEGARETLAALEIGAMDFIPKHLSNNVMNIVHVKEDLIRKVKALAGRKKTLSILARERDTQKQSPGVGIRTEKLREDFSHLSHSSRRIRVVAIGTSTGGPMALQSVLPRLPKDFPVGILVVQHMPPSFTGPFAERLAQLCQVQVREARDGEKVIPGLAFIAPGGYHMRVQRKGLSEIEVRLSKEPSMLHMPSVDVMMTSVAQVYEDSALGVIMTGMGHDGQDGMKAIKGMKGKTLAQDEETCVVFGMPKAAIDSGVVDKVVSLNQLAGEIVNMV
jgi:two-component system chemotaxis response regulator CheB